MKKEDLEFYINNKKAELNKKKVYRRNVKVSFKGKAILINNKLQDNDINKRIEITNKNVIKQNGDYTIVYTINENSHYIDFYIKKRYMFVFLLLIFLLFTFVLLKPISEKIKILRQLNIGFIFNDFEQIEERKYMFKVNAKGYNNSNFQRILIANTVDKEKITEETIAPGTFGKFEIIINNYDSNVDFNYFFDIIEENTKPNNLYFKIGENKYNTLQELANKELTGIIEQNKQKIVPIHWYWDYEVSDERDYIDTIDAINIENYSFKIKAIGKEIYVDNK